MDQNILRVRRSTGQHLTHPPKPESLWVRKCPAESPLPDLKRQKELKIFTTWNATPQVHQPDSPNRRKSLSPKQIYCTNSISLKTIRQNKSNSGDDNKTN
jgi:hypothetical protein